MHHNVPFLTARAETLRVADPFRLQNRDLLITHSEHQATDGQCIAKKGRTVSKDMMEWWERKSKEKKGMGHTDKGGGGRKEV